MDRTGADRTGADKSGADRTGTDGTSIDMIGTNRSGQVQTGQELTGQHRQESADSITQIQQGGRDSKKKTAQNSYFLIQCGVCKDRIQ